MNSRITAILIGLLSVTGVFATTVIEQNDSITNEIVSDSITMAMPSDSITIQVTDTDSIARQQEADKNLLSLLVDRYFARPLHSSYAVGIFESCHPIIFFCRIFRIGIFRAQEPVCGIGGCTDKDGTVFDQHGR